MARSPRKNINIRNKRASFDFEFIDKYTTGIVLTGTEIKSLREGKANLQDSFCYFANNELWCKGMHIAEYSFGSYNNHAPTRERKLLLKKKELAKIQENSKEKGLTIIVTRVFINDRGWAKCEIAIARGKKQFDKRESIKEKDAKRTMDRVMKNY